ncbi:MAG TPA: amidohydrolase family protein, partial [Candidatus Binatia bacterium]|nr:amidohydrolase family protein [Candidatus Binatia bacterium]
LISNISCGLPYEERRPFDPLPGENYETSPGTGSPQQRLREQDKDGVDAEVLFPGNVGPGFWRGIQNDEAYKAVVRSYNDWLAEEYCSYAPERLIGVGVIPITNITDAVSELKHCADLGLKAVAIDSFPAGQKYPTSNDDPFWAAVIDLDMALTIHVQFGFPRRGRGAPTATGPSFKYPTQPNPEHHVPDVIERFNKYGFRGSIQVVQMIWGGVFDRFPKLNIYVAEVQIGWVPNWMDQMDNEYGRQRFWAERVLGLPQLRRPPSEYARENCYWGFNRNPVGVRIARQEMGVDHVMWASDFPHLESDWPNSQRVIEENFASVPEEEKWKMIVANAVKYFRLDDQQAGKSVEDAEAIHASH